MTRAARHGQTMNFGLITRSPIPYDPESGREAVAALPGLPADMAGLIAGAAGCSPYLKALMLRERDWLEGALTCDPAVACARRT